MPSVEDAQVFLIKDEDAGFVEGCLAAPGSESTQPGDLSNLLTLLPQSFYSGSNAIVKTEVGDAAASAPVFEGDLNSARYESSSSGSASPNHPGQEVLESAPKVPNVTVDDIDMWEVLEALEGPTTLSSAQLGSEHDSIFGYSGQIDSPLGIPSASQHPQIPFAAEARYASMSATPLLLPKAKVQRTSPTVACVSEIAEQAGAQHKRQAPAAKPPSVGAASSEAAGSDEERCCKAEGGEGGEDSLDPNEEKRLKRMRRNRESAAMSRNRKKMYIEELESKVASLTATVQQLQSENTALKAECSSYRGSDTFSSFTAVAQPQTADERERTDEKPSDDATAPVVSVLGKRASAASLALMSALTFVTFTLSGRHMMEHDNIGQTSHSPTSRILMSIPGDLTNAHSYAGLLNREPKADDHALWHKLNIDTPLESSWLPSPEEHHDAPERPLPPRMPAAPAAPMHKVLDRVTYLPQNSGWKDALRVETEDGERSKRQVALASAGLNSGGANLALVQSPNTWTQHDEDQVLYQERYARKQNFKYTSADKDTLFELEDEEPEDLEHLDEEARERFIFCSRAYMFDASRHAKRAGRRVVHVSPGSAPPSSPPPPPAPLMSDFELPAAMPARFRHAASMAAPATQLPQLTDGSSNQTASDGAHSNYPVVNLLLPSAALRGVVDLHGESWSRQEARDPSQPGDLTQLSCRILNASRFGES